MKKKIKRRTNNMAKKINSKKTVVEVAEPINLAEIRYPSACGMAQLWGEGYSDSDRFTVKSIKNCIKALDKIIATGGRNEFTAQDLGVPVQTLRHLSTAYDSENLLSIRYDDFKITKRYVNVDNPDDIITITRKENRGFYRLNKNYTIEDVKKMREDLIQRFFTI
jgi:hypothetical protein